MDTEPRNATIKPGLGGGLGLTLLGLAFLIVGGLVGHSGLRNYLLARDAADWPEVEARLNFADLETHHDSDGGMTYKAVAKYEYEFDGGLHRGSRVGIGGGADNIGDWQRDTARRLQSALAAGRPVPCFVNPDDPSEALLDRELRAGLLGFKLLFLVIFGGAGALMLVGGARALIFGGEATPLVIDPPRWTRDTRPPEAGYSKTERPGSGD